MPPVLFFLARKTLNIWECRGQVERWAVEIGRSERGHLRSGWLSENRQSGVSHNLFLIKSCQSPEGQTAWPHTAQPLPKALPLS